jgi:rhodanese-related sulfurtransferase
MRLFFKPIKPIKLTFLFLGLCLCQSASGGPAFQAESIPKEWLNSGFKQHTFSLYLQPEELLKPTTPKDEIILIDVRAKEDYEKIRIPNSLNIPLFAIKTKNFLKSKQIVLLNEGHNYEALEKECFRLKVLGFSAKILNGGLCLWRSRGGEFAGDVSALNEINQIPAKDFFVEKNYQNWKVVNAAYVISSDAQFLIPSAMHIPFKNEKQFISALEKKLEKEHISPYQGLILFNENGSDYPTIEKAVQKTRNENVFFLKKGLAGYKEFLEQEIQIKKNKGQVQKTRTKCPTCPE